jgi:hypothetical protein
VVLREDVVGEKSLVAYVVAQDAAAAPTAADLRARLKSKLLTTPPSAIVFWRHSR